MSIAASYDETYSFGVRICIRPNVILILILRKSFIYKTDRQIRTQLMQSILCNHKIP